MTLQARYERTPHYESRNKFSILCIGDNNCINEAKTLKQRVQTTVLNFHYKVIWFLLILYKRLK